MKENVGIKLRDLRQELGLSQEKWAKLLQVTPNTIARWERGEFSPRGAHKKKGEQMVAIGKDERAKETLRKTLSSDSGLPAAAAFIGMLFGVMGVLEVNMSMLGSILKSDSSILKGIEDYIEDGAAF